MLQALAAQVVRPDVAADQKAPGALIRRRPDQITDA